MKDSFTDLQTFPSQKTLFPEEISAVVTLIDEILDLFDERPNKGTIILDGQRKGEDAQCILRMNLEKGAYRREFFKMCERTSVELAEESIDLALEWPEKPTYGYVAEAKNFGEMPTNAYLNGSHKVLVLNTTFGRFVMSFQLALEKGISGTRSQVELVDYYDESIAAMKGIAVALAKMGKEDLVLRQSVKRLKKDMTVKERRVKEEVENLLYFCSLPELQAWKEWHEVAMAKSEGLALYFG